MLQTRQIIVKGKVQGVYFRQRTLETASQLDITGTVRNLGNGDVEIIATGTEQQLQTLIEWCHHGPSRAKVEKIIIDVLPLRSANNFTIVR
jgi:acylphosphatase